MGQSGSKTAGTAASAAANAVRSNLKYPGSAGPASVASRISVSPSNSNSESFVSSASPANASSPQNISSEPAFAPRSAPDAVSTSGTSTFKQKLSAFQNRQQRQFEESDKQTEEFFDPNKPQDSVSSKNRNKLLEMLQSSHSRRETRWGDRIQLTEVSAMEEPGTAHSVHPAENVVHEFRTDGSVAMRDPSTQPPEPEFEAPQPQQQQQQQPSISNQMASSSPSISSTAADPNSVEARFPQMSAHKKALEELNRKDEVLLDRLSNVWGNIVSSADSTKKNGPQTAEPIQSATPAETPKYGYHPPPQQQQQQQQQRSRRPLPQKSNSSLSLTEEDLARLRVPRGKLDTAMLVRVMVTQKMPRSEWNLPQLSQKYGIEEQVLERLLTINTLPWLLPEGEHVGAYKSRPDAPNAVLMGENFIKENIHSKLSKTPQKVVETGLGGIM